MYSNTPFFSGSITGCLLQKTNPNKLIMSEHSAIIRLHTEENGTLDYDPSVPCIIASHIGFMPEKEFKDFLNLGLKLMIEKRKTHGKIGWLADTSQMGAIEDEGWANRDWNPRALAEGIQHVAFVLPHDVFGQTIVETYNEQNMKAQPSSKMSTGVFEDIESAKEWLHHSLSNSVANSCA